MIQLYLFFVSLSFCKEKLGTCFKSTGQSNCRPHELQFEVTYAENGMGVKEDERVGFLKVGPTHMHMYDATPLHHNFALSSFNAI